MGLEKDRFSFNRKRILNLPIIQKINRQNIP